VWQFITFGDYKDHIRDFGVNEEVDFLEYWQVPLMVIDNFRSVRTMMIVAQFSRWDEHFFRMQAIHIAGSSERYSTRR
jgi:hypothetical protein